MHLSFLTSEYPHPKVHKAAGIATSIKNLVNGLAEKGVTVTLFVYNQLEDSVFEENGITFHLIKYHNYKFFGFYLYRKHIEKYVNRQIVMEKIDAVEAPDWTGITAFMKLKAPLVIRFHGSDTYFCSLEKRKQKWKNRFFENNAVRKAQAHIAPTTYAGLKSVKLFKLDHTKLTIIHYGLQLDHFINDAHQEFQKFQIVNIGTVIRKKGVFQLAEIFNNVIEKYDQAELILIGSDSPDLKTGSSSTWELVEKMLSEKAKKSVSYLGKVPYEAVKGHIKNAHVCVFPSLAETLGMVTIEAMALQKVVLNTNYGWALELIDHEENGYLIDPYDIDGYTSTISQVFDDHDRTLSIGIAARKKIENTFEINTIVQKNITFYRALITK
jgi:glycosyltransferase involved in cell wall biosynthesis